MMLSRDGKGSIWRTAYERTAIMTAAILAFTMLTTLSANAATERAVKTKVPPVYPELAKRMKISGVVKVEATVDPDGKVTGVKTLNGNSALQNAAEEAVRKWKFVPGDGNATVDVEVTFAMSQ
jgi:TonB family protein